METRFEFRDLTKVFGLAIALYALLAALLSLSPSVSELLNGLHPAVSFLLQYALQFLILFFPLWLFVVDKYSVTFKDFGFQPVKAWTLIKTVFLTYLLYLLISGGMALLLESLQLSIPGYRPQESYLPLFGDDVLGLSVGFLLVVGVAPFLEELLFRGFVYRVLTKTFPLGLGGVVTALLFALIHMQFQNIIPLFILGLLLNFAYRRTGSVWTCVAFHAFNNGIAFALSVYLSFHPEFLEHWNGLSLESASSLLYTGGMGLWF